MSEELTEAREWLRRYLHDEGVVFNHNATAMENEILAGLAPIIRRQVAEEIAQAIEAVDPVEWALAGQHAGQDAAALARRVGDPS